MQCPGVCLSHVAFMRDLHEIQRSISDGLATVSHPVKVAVAGDTIASGDEGAKYQKEE
jgi:hypothetical protein